MEKFTVEEFRNYLLKQDSRGDIMYNLSAENIRKANEIEIDVESVERCSHYDCAQGKHWCTTTLNASRTCNGVCEFYEEKREYLNDITKQTYGDLMTVKDWNQAVEDGMFIDSDGCGYWVKDGKESRDDEVFSSPQLDATHVMWYNK